jgi:putative transposase
MSPRGSWPGGSRVGLPGSCPRPCLATVWADGSCPSRRLKADVLLMVATPAGREVSRTPAPKSLTAAQDRLRALQRKAARQVGPYDPQMRVKREPSKRWQRAQRRIARMHARAAAVRRDVLHKATTDLAQRHQVITPSSKTCSACGRRKPNLTLADRTYVCEHCGLMIDRDLNAAINLARLGDTPHTGGTRTGTGSRPAADHRVGDGRGATQETATTPVVNATGCEASTRHDTTAGVGQTGAAPPEGEAA